MRPRNRSHLPNDPLAFRSRRPCQTQRQGCARAAVAENCARLCSRGSRKDRPAARVAGRSRRHHPTLQWRGWLENGRHGLNRYLRDVLRRALGLSSSGWPSVALVSERQIIYSLDDNKEAIQNLRHVYFDFNNGFLLKEVTLSKKQNKWHNEHFPEHCGLQQAD